MSKIQLRAIFAIFSAFLIPQYSHATKVDWTHVEALTENHLTLPALAVKDARLEVYNFESRPLFIYEKGSFSRYKRVPILSATKWLTAALTMALVENGLISLDSPTTDYLDDQWFSHLSPEQKDRTLERFKKISVRKLLSLTAPIPETNSCVYNPRVTMTDCTKVIIETALHNTQINPNKIQFVYGDSSFTVLGSIAEQVTQKSFESAFNDYIAIPLGITTPIEFYAKPRKKFGNQNPRPAAGAIMSVHEYELFLRMLSNKGKHQGQQILTKKSIKIISTDQVRVLKQRNGEWVPFGFQRSYGLGNFIDCLDLWCRKKVNSSPGLNGFTPFIDFDQGYYAILGIFKADPQMSTKIRPLHEDLFNYLSRTKLLPANVY